MNNTMIGSYIRGDESYSFEFYTSLSAANKVKFVNSISDILVGENYNSVLRDLLFDFFVVDIFAIDVDTYEVRTSDYFLNDVEEFLDETNIVDIIKANAEDGVMEELSEALDKNIAFRTGIHPNPLNDALAGLVNTLEKKLSDIDLDAAMEMVSAFTGITEDFTPQSIMDAYMNTDIAKKNIKELEESKAKRNEFIDGLADEDNKVIDINSGKKSAKKSSGASKNSKSKSVKKDEGVKKDEKDSGKDAEK